MDSRRLASVLDASWPWLFGGTVALTGSYAVYRIFVKNDAGKFLRLLLMLLGILPAYVPEWIWGLRS